MKIEKIIEGLFLLVVSVLFATATCVLYAYFVKWMINWLITPSALVAVFGSPQIGFWQAYTLTVLCSFLFKSSTTVKTEKK